MFGSQPAMFESLKKVPLKFLHALKEDASSRPIRDFTGDRFGVDYVFEFDSESRSGCITSSGRKICEGDRLRLPDGDRVAEYEVVAVDYYCNPSDMWIAKVKPVSPETQQS
ncbi:MAG: hypothetical protein AAFX40_01465 [Cyanobacteria bacterium J06639_1]